MNRYFVITCLLAIGGIGQLPSQSPQDKDGYTQVTYEEIESKKNLKELFPDNISDTGSPVVSYEATFASDGANLKPVVCIGEALCPDFFENLNNFKPTHCLLYFDKITVKNANGALLKLPGFVLEIVTPQKE